MLVYILITSVYSPKEESHSVRWSQDSCQLQETYNQAVVLSSPSPPVFHFCLEVLSSFSSTPVRIRSRIRGCVHLFGLVQSGSVPLSVPLLLQSTGPSERFFFRGVLIILSVGLLMIGFCVWLATVSTMRCCFRAFSSGSIWRLSALPWWWEFWSPNQDVFSFFHCRVSVFFHCNRFYFIVHLICGETLSS